MLIKKEKTELDARLVLLQTAARLFAEHGFEAVSTRMLAKEAGVNMAMIAYYFGSKEKLFEAIIDEYIPKTREALLNIVQQNITSWEKFSMAMEVFVDKMFSNNTFSKLIYRELSLQQRPVHSERIMEAVMRNWQIMKEIIAEGQQNRTFRNDIDVVMTLASVFGTILQIVNTPMITARAMQAEAQNDVFSDTNRLRLKTHLKQMMQAHLLVDNDENEEEEFQVSH